MLSHLLVLLLLLMHLHNLVSVLVLLRLVSFLLRLGGVRLSLRPALRSVCAGVPAMLVRRCLCLSVEHERALLIF